MKYMNSGTYSKDIIWNGESAHYSQGFKLNNEGVIESRTWFWNLEMYSFKLENNLRTNRKFEKKNMSKGWKMFGVMLLKIPKGGKKKILLKIY